MDMVRVGCYFPLPHRSGVSPIIMGPNRMVKGHFGALLKSHFSAVERGSFRRSGFGARTQLEKNALGAHKSMKPATQIDCFHTLRQEVPFVACHFIIHLLQNGIG